MEIKVFFYCLFVEANVFGLSSRKPKFFFVVVEIKDLVQVGTNKKKSKGRCVGFEFERVRKRLNRILWVGFIVLTVNRVSVSGW